jgi:5-methylcytosine-specific restriction endonuclease McrA
MTAVFERDGWRCRYCHIDVAKASPHIPRAQWATLDHAIPRSRGGSGRKDNLVTACMPCNTRKRDKTPEEYMAWYLPRVDSEETRL